MVSLALDDLVDISFSFNEAVLDQTMWEPSLERMATAFGGSFATFEWIDKSSGRHIQHFDNSELEIKDEYLNYYMPLNPRIAFGNRRNSPHILHDNIFMAEQEMDRHEFYSDFLRSFDLRYFLAFKAYETKDEVALFTIQKGAQTGSANEDELRAMKQLAPSLRSAANLHVQHSRTLARIQSLESAFEASDNGILLLNEFGQIDEMNSTAASILRNEDGLVHGNGRLNCTSLNIDKKLNDALHLTGGDKILAPINTKILVPRPSGLAPYQLSVQRIAGYENTVSQTGSAFIIIITDPSRRRFVEISELMDGFGLTSAEANVALSIAMGGTAQEIATELNLALPTIRTHIQRIMHKLSVNKQADIVGIVARYF